MKQNELIANRTTKSGQPTEGQNPQTSCSQPQLSFIQPQLSFSQHQLSHSQPQTACSDNQTLTTEQQTYTYKTTTFIRTRLSEERCTAGNIGLAENAARNIPANFEVPARRHFGKPLSVSGYF